MRKRLLAAMCLVGFALSACMQEAPTPPPSPTASPTSGQRLTGEVHVGVVLTLTGRNGPYGSGQLKALDVAVERLNRTDALGGARMVLEVEDDAGEADRAQAAFQRLLDRGDILAIIGTTLSNSFLPSAPLAQRAGVPVIAPSTTAEGIVGVGDYMFRVCLGETQVTPLVVAAAKERLGLRRVAILWGRDDAFTRSGHETFRDAALANGIDVVADESFGNGEIDFREQLTRIMAAQPDAIIVSALGREAVSILFRTRKLDIRLPIIGGHGFNSLAVAKDAGTAANDLIVGSIWNVGDANAANQDFIRDFRAAWDDDPDQYAAEAYVAATVLADGIRRAGTIQDRAKLRDALATVQLDTIMGPFHFLPTREPDLTPRVQIIKHGRYAALR